MWVKVDDYNAIKKAFDLMLTHANIGNVSEEVRAEFVDAFAEAQVAFHNINKRHEADNDKVANYLAKRRETDKCFGRSKEYRESYEKKHSVK